MGPYGKYAKQYRKLGWDGTLPLPPGQKHPPPKGYTGSGRPHPTDVEVARWCKSDGDGNIALRLAEVRDAILHERNDLPVVYAGNNVDGWETLGIDVDNYGEKHGYDDLSALEAEHGELPATAISTARWGTGSGTAVYLVPRGYRYMGKAAPGIDVIQKRHRFTAVHPSTNPDANGATYEWLHGKPSDLNYGVGQPATAFEEFDGLPNLATDDIVVLPVAWFMYLSRQGTLESDDPISNMTDDQLHEWLLTLRFDEEPCDRMQRVCAKWIERLEESASSHDKLTPAHWELLNVAAEGHSGVSWALNTFHNAWWEHVKANAGRDIETAQAEIARSITGALDKIQPFYEGLGRPDDTCLNNYGDADAWMDMLANKEDSTEIEDADNMGLGPIVGKMPLGDAKPADGYGRHDDGNGQHFADLYGANAKYVGARKNWILWDDERWHRDQEDRLVRAAYRRVRMRQERYASELYAQALANDDKELKAVAKAWSTHAKRSGDAGPVKSALEMARHCYVGDEPVVLSANDLDGNINLLGCANGVLDLSQVDERGNPEIEVRKPCKEDYVTYNTNVEYRPWRDYVNGEAGHFEAWEIWQDYLNSFLPNMELQMFVRKVLGHMLVGENPEKKIVFLFGKRDTGKSTLIGAVTGALGDYYGTIDMNLFRHKDLNPGLARALPLRVTGMSEMEETSKTGVIDASVVKRLTGNDKLTVELKYSNDIIDAKPQFTTVIACNNPPRITNADEALHERLLVLPLESQVDKRKRKYERQKQIERLCGPVVLSWLIEGWKDYQRDKLERDMWPQVVLEANRTFAADLNTVSRYIEQHLVIARECEEGRRVLAAAIAKAKDKGKEAPTSHDYPLEWTPEAARLYEHYRRCAQKTGDEPVDMQQFTRDLGVGRTVNRKIKGKSTSVYIGVRFKDDPGEDTTTSIARKF